MKHKVFGEVILGDITFFGDKPPEEPVRGDRYINRNTGILRIYDGQKWIKIGQMEKKKTKLQAITPNIEQTIVEIARVSSSREDKSAEPEKLLNYLIKNKHWSPFEHGYITMEIETSKAIAIQLLRHRSFTFQEFSQRYQDVNELDTGEGIFEDVELRKQAENNRQSSEEVFNPTINVSGLIRGVMPGMKVEMEAREMVNQGLLSCQMAYNALIDAGVAREVARMVLPMATKTRLYMTGPVRSWIHFLDLRDDSHAQKEVQIIAKEIKSILIEELPIVAKSLGWSNK
jgi:thymidylate synthase (FAD)